MNISRGKCILNIFAALMLAAVLVVSVILAYALLCYDRKAQPGGELHSIAIEGEYSEEGSSWKPLTPDTHFENLTFRDITVRGHFTRDLPQGENLFLNIDHMRVSLRVNGEEIFRLVPERGDGNLTQAMGKQYVTIVSPGITTGDMVEMSFGNLYRNAYMIQFDELLWHMHTGDEGMMLLEAIRKDGWPLGIGALFVFLTLFLMILAICCAALRIRGALRFLWLGLTSLSSALWFFTLTPAPTLILPWPVFLNVLYAYSMQCMVLFVVLFVIGSVSGWRRQLLIICEVIILSVLLIGLLNQLFGIQDLYSAINYLSLFDLAAAFCVAFCLVYEAYCLKKKEVAALLISLSLLIVCAVIELINGYFQFCEAAVLLGIGFISFIISVGIYMLYRIKCSLNNEKRTLILESELNQSQVRITLSQIQPHFLYNALNTIRFLCKAQPEDAKRAIENFSAYLRGNMDSLTQKNTIPFTQELEHLENYLFIERLRFPEISFVYDLQAKDFWLPALCVQPMVENAIKHGALGRDEGGTVKISSWEAKDGWYVRVEDDGVGFDPVQPVLDEARSHIGIGNTRSRLEAMCGGSLVIKSTPGTGTIVTIVIPKEET